MNFEELKDRILTALSEQSDPRARLIEQAIHDLERAEPIYPLGLREAWLDYRAYRKREGKGWYKTLKTEQTAIDGLMKRSNNDVNCLKDAIQQTIECRYSGIFPKPQSNSRDRSTQINATLRKGGFTI
jgi:hypothetical protein